MHIRFEVENIKCGGCAGSIRNALMKDARVREVSVDVAAGTVEVETSEDAREDLAQVLRRLGYPETGSARGLDAVGARARSFVSCAVGRLDGAQD